MPGLVLGLPNLTGAYKASGTGIHMNLDSTRGGLRIDGTSLAAGTTGTSGSAYWRTTRGAENALTVSYNATDSRTYIYTSATNGADFAPDPAVLPERSTISLLIDKMEFLRQDRTITASLAGSGLFLLDSTLTLDFASSTLGAFILFNPTVRFKQSTNAFGQGLLLNAAGIQENDPSVAANMSVALGVVHQTQHRANAQAISMTQLRSFVSQPIFGTTGGGTLTGISTFWHYFAAGQINSGAAVTGDRICFKAADLTSLTGTLSGRNIAIDVDNLTSGGGGAVGVLSNMASGANRYFIQHTGTAVSNFGGDVKMTGSALVDHAVSNALGAGAAATLGTIGGSGPATAAQWGWVRIKVAGTNTWIPAWR